MKTATSIQDIKNIPFFSQFTADQIRRQVERSREGLEQMRDRAIKTGKKVGGQTAGQLQEGIDRYAKILAG